MLRKTMLFSLSLCLAVAAGQADAQVIVPGNFGPVVTPGQVYTPPIQNQVYYPPYIPNQVTYPGTVTYPGRAVTYPSYPTYPTYPTYPGTAWRPSTPAVVTPNTYTGYNPQTGGLNTANNQVNNTYFDPLRNQSQLNNRRWEQRPIYGTNGQVTGYQQGWVWNNVVTGQEHGNVQTYTPNATGGVHEGNVAYSRSDGNE